MRAHPSLSESGRGVHGHPSLVRTGWGQGWSTPLAIAALHSFQLRLSCFALLFVLPNCLLFSQFSKNSVAPNLVINPQSPIASPCPVSGQDTSVSAALLIPADNVSTQFIVLPALASGGLLLCSPSWQGCVCRAGFMWWLLCLHHILIPVLLKMCNQANHTWAWQRVGLRP
jgi:hypothetical protein